MVVNPAMIKTAALETIRWGKYPGGTSASGTLHYPSQPATLLHHTKALTETQSSTGDRLLALGPTKSDYLAALSAVRRIARRSSSLY